MINEDNSLGALTRTYIGRTLAHIEGTNPATGTARYYLHDNLGSSRSVRNADKSLYASFEHTPYGDLYASTGAASSIDRRFTGHAWDPAAHLYYAPFRYYSPSAARWMTRDRFALQEHVHFCAYLTQSPVDSVDVSAAAGRKSREVAPSAWHIPNEGDVHLPGGACLNFSCLGADAFPIPHVIKGLECISRALDGECIQVTGGWRAPSSVHYRKTSQHSTGNAADIANRGTKGKGDELFCAAKACGFTYGLYHDNHYHIDMGPNRGGKNNRMNCPECSHPAILWRFFVKGNL